jgi:hypothetical protein
MLLPDYKDSPAEGLEGKHTLHGKKIHPNILVGRLVVQESGPTSLLSNPSAKLYTGPGLKSTGRRFLEMSIIQSIPPLSIATVWCFALLLLLTLPG